MLRALLAVILLGLTAPLSSASVVAAEKAQTTAKAIRSGFVVLASIVTDADWREKWNTPPETTPKFHGPGKMKPGDKAWLLTFFAGAKLKDGMAVLKCDLAIRDPDGSVDKHPAQLCYQGPTPGQAGTLFLTGLEVGFEVSPKDLDGLVTFEIGITDVNRGLRIPVKVSVEFDTGNQPT